MLGVLLQAIQIVPQISADAVSDALALPSSIHDHWHDPRRHRLHSGNAEVFLSLREGSIEMEEYGISQRHLHQFVRRLSRRAARQDGSREMKLPALCSEIVQLQESR